VLVEIVERLVQEACRARRNVSRGWFQAGLRVMNSHPSNRVG